MRLSYYNAYLPTRSFPKTLTQIYSARSNTFRQPHVMASSRSMVVTQSMTVCNGHEHSASIFHAIKKSVYYSTDTLLSCFTLGPVRGAVHRTSAAVLLAAAALIDGGADAGIQEIAPPPGGLGGRRPRRKCRGAACAVAARLPAGAPAQPRAGSAAAMTECDD